MTSRRIFIAVLSCALLAVSVAERAAAAGTALDTLAPKLERLALRSHGIVAVSVADLSGSQTIAINGDANLPAASIIKIPVMVELFRQIAQSRFTQTTTVSLTDGDRDCGYGNLCNAHWGTKYTVSRLAKLMIAQSDNTATNMLIRLIGRQNINATMSGLGLTQTHLGDSIRSDGDIRSLRTSTNEMMRLLIMIAEHRVVSADACDAMLAILAAQRHNTLLPRGLPIGLTIAHKTGTLHDTLNDVGIVYLDGAPYVICVFTTHQADLDDGELFIRTASRLTYQAFAATAPPTPR